MTTFFLGNETRFQERQILQFKGEVKKHFMDASVWADDNATVNTVNWTVEQGNVSISDVDLSFDNVSDMTLSTPEAGTSMIKVVMGDGTLIEAAYIKVVVKDPKVVIDRFDDYGFRC